MARDPLRPPGRSGFGARILRTILIALIIAFTVGFLIGTLLRKRLDEPVRYYGYENGPAPLVLACDTARAKRLTLGQGQPARIERHSKRSSRIRRSRTA